MQFLVNEERMRQSIEERLRVIGTKKNPWRTGAVWGGDFAVGFAKCLERKDLPTYDVFEIDAFEFEDMDNGILLIKIRPERVLAPEALREWSGMVGAKNTFDTALRVSMRRSDGSMDPMPFFIVRPDDSDEEPYRCILMAPEKALVTSRPEFWTAVDATELPEMRAHGCEIDRGQLYAFMAANDNITIPNPEEGAEDFVIERPGDYLRFDDLLFGVMGLVGYAEHLGQLKSRPVVIRSGKRITEAMRATTKRGVYARGDGEYIVSGDLMITADEVGTLEASVGMSKTLAWLDHLATVSGYGYKPNLNCVVETSITELMEVRRLKDTRSNRDRVKHDLMGLSRWGWEWQDANSGEWSRVPLAGGVVNIKRGGKVTFTISAAFMKAVLNSRSSLVPLDPALLGTDDKRHPHAFTIGYKLRVHNYQNKGKANENTLSFEKLTEYVETLPRPEEVTGRNLTQKIVEPLERDLEHLVELGILEWWDYCHAGGEPLTDEEQAARLDADGEEKPLPYAIAKNALIQWQLANPYDEHMDKVLEARERRRLEGERAAEEKVRQDKRIERKKETRIAQALAEKELKNREEEG